MGTLASDIITRAYRETNLIPLVATPNANQQTEALTLLNGQLLEMLGFEAGDDVSELNIGGTYDQSSYCSQWIPTNCRLVLNLSGAKTFNLHPQPYDGQRLSFVDVGNNLATYNLTLSGNGRLIEAVANLVLNTNGDARQWMYRADIANWQKITTLLYGDAFPLPPEFDSFFVTRLAIRLNPRYGIALAPETKDELDRIEAKLQARYRKPKPVQDTGTLGLLGQRRGNYGLGQADFNAGRTYRW